MEGSQRRAREVVNDGETLPKRLTHAPGDSLLPGQSFQPCVSQEDFSIMLTLNGPSDWPRVHAEVSMCPTSKPNPWSNCPLLGGPQSGQIPGGPWLGGVGWGHLKLCVVIGLASTVLLFVGNAVISFCFTFICSFLSIYPESAELKELVEKWQTLMSKQCDMEGECKRKEQMNRFSCSGS